MSIRYKDTDIKFIRAHMAVAEIYGNLSHAVRAKVGCIIVKNGRIISIGYNGRVSGGPNECEYVDPETGKMCTRDDVIHAEMNAIFKLASSTESAVDSCLFCTHAPCLLCAIAIYQTGISNVFFRESYRDTSGIDFLRSYGIYVEQVECIV